MVQSISAANGDHQTSYYFLRQEGKVESVWPLVKARLHRRFLSRQLDAIFVALKLQLQNRTCKPGAIFSAICRRDTAGVSNMFET